MPAPPESLPRASTDRRIRGLRPAWPAVDVWTAHGSVVEDERLAAGNTERSLTVFLAGAECPFTCSFCDLWRYTIEGPTPAGALPAQLSAVLRGLDRPLPDRLKLYNASNFFDARAVPLADLPALAGLSAPFSGVTVESHASTIGPATRAFADMLAGRLEVAIGLETIHEAAVARLNKRLSIERFDRAADWLATNDVDLRVFVLLGAPHVPPAESVEWTVRSVEHAVRRGARMVAIIPVRGGNGELERLAAAGEFTPPTLAQLEQALEASIHHRDAVVTVDLWDVERLATCTVCAGARVERLRRGNLTGTLSPRVSCSCGT